MRLRFYRPGERLMTHITDFLLFFSTERINEKKIKAPTAASKTRPTTSEGVFLSENARNAAGSAGQSTRECKFLDIIFEVCKFTTFCDRKGYGNSRLYVITYSKQSHLI